MPLDPARAEVGAPAVEMRRCIAVPVPLAGNPHSILNHFLCDNYPTNGVLVSCPAVGFLSVPIVAVLSYLLVPHTRTGDLALEKISS
jgi:hypothetical protein